MEKETKTVVVTAHPYAVQYGRLKVPKGLTEEAEKAYIREKFSTITFSDPELDYKGTDFDWAPED